VDLVAVFGNKSRNSFALVSYKVHFSRFLYSHEWNFRDNWPSFRIIVNAAIKAGVNSTYQTIRVEDDESAISQIRDVDFSRRTNPSFHLERDCEITARH
jgi:hypothetical protein